ncbi:MAG: Rnase Y domain-containing protein, partial [Armatimonadetes bacterium]|nr:Rnase Y domain-containing protein [Armatimonadota bacterium]
MDGLTLALIDVAAMAAFGALAYAFWILPNLHRARRAAEEAQKEIETRVKEARLQAMEEALKARAQMEEEIRERQRALSRQEEKLAAKEEALEERRARLHQREQELDASRARLAAAEARVEALRAEVERELERIGRISKDEARALVIQRAEEDAREAAQRRAKIVES